MSNMPEFGDTGEERTREVPQSVEEDPIDANAPKKEQNIHANDLRADCHSCKPRAFIINQFKQYKAHVGKTMKYQDFHSTQMPLAMNKGQVVNQDPCSAGGNELRN